MRQFSIIHGGHVSTWPDEDTSGHCAYLVLGTSHAHGLNEADALDGLAEYLEAIARRVRAESRRIALRKGA